MAGASLGAGLAVYATVWAAFGSAHSILARECPKHWLKRHTGRWMRLMWNAIATLQLAAVIWIGRAVIPHPPAFHRPTWLIAAQVLSALLGLLILILASRSYDMGRFLGTAQLRHATWDDDEPFSAAGPLRWVRHPLYLGSILLLVAATANARDLATLVCATAYIVIGLRFEEAALLRRLGPDYQAYRQRVPALLPWRGRAWPP